MKKVIISAGGFAVAQTTNKAQPVGLWATTERAEKRKHEKALKCERRTEGDCANQQE